VPNHTPIDFAGLARRLGERMEALLDRLGLDKPTSRTATEWRYGRRRSLKVAVRGPDRGRYYSFEDENDRGDALALVKRELHLGTMLEAARWAHEWLGGPAPAPSPPSWPPRPEAPPLAPLWNDDEPDPAAGAAWAPALWSRCGPIAGTLAETYLRAVRGIRTAALLASLRFHPSLWHAWSGRRWPALVAGITVWPSRRVVAAHRTWLAPDSAGKAPVERPKAALGPVRGGAVRLAPLDPARELVIVEGIESGLAVLEATGNPVWAALSCSGYGALALPPPSAVPAGLVICADHDASGVGQRKAAAAADAWTIAGHRVRIALPPAADTDFNDLLTTAVEDAAA
jgi:hypothetical protein